MAAFTPEAAAAISEISGQGGQGGSNFGMSRILSILPVAAGVRQHAHSEIRAGNPQITMGAVTVCMCGCIIHVVDLTVDILSGVRESEKGPRVRVACVCSCVILFG